MPSIGSKPCSSRMPVSFREIPVFLHPINTNKYQLCPWRRSLPPSDSDVRVIGFALVTSRRS